MGALAFGFLVPALAGYIAYAIADRPGIAPGFTVGAIAGFVGAGFIGGLVGGLLAGFAALWISKAKVPPGPAASCPSRSSRSAPRSSPVAHAARARPARWPPSRTGCRTGCPACPAPRRSCSASSSA
jgi:hypothetical protein